MAQKRPEDSLALDWKLGVGFGKIWVLNHRQLGGQTSEFWTFSEFGRERVTPSPSLSLLWSSSSCEDQAEGGWGMRLSSPVAS